MTRDMARSKNVDAVKARSVRRTGAAALDADGVRRAGDMGRAAVSPARRATASRLPRELRFPLLVALSFAISAVAQQCLNQITSGERVRIERGLESHGQLAIWSCWKLIEMAVAWYEDYDSLDMAALQLLTHGPVLYLEQAFYGIRSLTALAALAIDVLSTAVPFLLFRALSVAHSPALATTAPNHEIITDRTILMTTMLTCGLVYNLVYYLACKTYLPGALLLYFSGIPTISPANDATWWPGLSALSFSNSATESGVASFVPVFPSTKACTTFYETLSRLAICMLFGAAARSFIFTPCAAATQQPRGIEFDPALATLAETARWNTWRCSVKKTVAIKRTSILALMTAASVYLHSVLKINGVEPWGGVAYAAVWAIAALLTGAWLGYVGDV